MAQPEATVHQVEIVINGKSLEQTKRELKQIEFQARKSAREVAKLIQAALDAAELGIAFELVKETTETGE